MTLKKLVFRWGPVLVWAGFIFYLSSQPNLQAVKDPAWDERIRSVLHACFYAIFYLLWYRALSCFTSKKRFYWSLVGVLVYAFLDEVHQHFVPTRTFQSGDLMMDGFGCLSGVWIIKHIIPKLPPKLIVWAKRLELV
ncbi:VanZ family protein [Patescibacteria group bacterium]|nr:VanZ family protein [Patescibacteria group bacterium]